MSEQTQTAKHHCIRCGRKLTDPTSIAAGMGRICRSHTRKTAAVIDLGAFRDAKAAKNNAVELIEQAAIVPAGRPGLYLSPSSDGSNTYLIDTLEGSCTCKGHVYSGHCKHAVAAAILEGSNTTRFAAAA